MGNKLTAMLEVTRKCNILCKHCYNSSSPTSTLQLTIDETKTLINDLKSVEEKYPLERIILTGGEFAFMDNSKEIFNLIRKSFDCIIRIETNGFLFLKGLRKLEDYNADEYYISVDKFHGSLGDYGTSEMLDFFVKNVSKKTKLIVRITIQIGEEKLRDKFLEEYSKYENVIIECKYVSPSGRAKDNYKKFKCYHFLDNPTLFTCRAKNYILFNVTRKWYCCYTACDLSYVANLGDKDLQSKFSNRRESKELKDIRRSGILSLIKNEDDQVKFLKEKFYYRCEPCLYLQNMNAKKVILLELPAVDTTQDVYTKGFIFATFTEKYLKKMLELAGLKVEYYNLNKLPIKETLEYINNSKLPVYIHLTANKLYSYELVRKMLNNPILLGGPVAKYAGNEFTNVTIIKDELEEVGILHYFNKMDDDNVWERADLLPEQMNNNFDNKSVNNDFSNIVLFSRGCLYNCNFCIHSVFHKKIHMRSIQSIEAELNTYKNKTSIYIADPSVGHMGLYKDILKLLSKYKNLSFSFNVRADQINDDFIDLIKQMNIDKLYVGVENPDNKVLKEYNKGEEIETISNALELLRKNKINYHLSFLISDDLDLEKVKEIDNKYKASTYSFHFYIPYPGTRGYKDLEIFKDKEWPYNVSKSIKNGEKLKNEIAKYFGYPVNKYHTITPHDHNETFKIINKKLEELEKAVSNHEKHK